MRAGSIRRTVLSVVMVALCVMMPMGCPPVPGAAGGDVLVNTFGLDDSYIANSGWTLGTASGYTGGWGIGFVPEVTGTVSAYQIAVFRVTGGDTLDAQLLSDSSDYPGALIEQFTFHVPSGFNDLMLSAQSTADTLLTAGTRYWLIVSPPDVASETFGWYRNLPLDAVLNAEEKSPPGTWTIRAAEYAPTLKIMGDCQ